MKSRYIAIAVFVFLSFLAGNTAALTIKQQSGLLHNKLMTAQGSEKVYILLKLASLYSNDSTLQAIGFSRRAIAEGERLNDKYPLAKAYVNLASLFIQTHQFPDSAIAYLNSAEKAFALTAPGLPAAAYFYNLARYHLWNRDTVMAISEGQVAVEKASQENDHLTLALTGMMLGKIYQKKGNFNGLVEWLGMAEQSFMLCDEKFLAGPAMISLGILYKDAGLQVKGDNALVNAIALCEQSGDSLYLGYLYCNVSGIFMSGSEPEKALTLLNKAVKNFQALCNTYGLGYALNHLGIYYRNQKKSREAISCFEKAITCKNETGDYQGACFAACNMAEVYMEEREYAAVTATFREAEQWMKKAGDQLSATVYYNTYAKFLVMNKEYTAALEAFTISLQNARESFNHNFVTENLKQLADLHQSMGNESLALQSYKSYVTAGDSIKEAANEQSYREMQTELTNLTGKTADDAPVSTDSPRLNEAVIPVLIILIFLLTAISMWKIRTHFTKKTGKMPEYPLAVSTGEVQDSRAAINLECPKSAGHSLSQEMSEDIFCRLQQLMEKEKYFLRCDLSLSELAEVLDTNTSYLSRVINERTGENFHAYLNKYRIEEACNLLKQHHQQYLSMEGIAQTSGFKSKSAFNVAFRKFKGMTPSAFCENHKDPI